MFVGGGLAEFRRLSALQPATDGWRRQASAKPHVSAGLMAAVGPRSNHARGPKVRAGAKGNVARTYRVRRFSLATQLDNQG